MHQTSLCNELNAPVDRVLPPLVGSVPHCAEIEGAIGGRWSIVIGGGEVVGQGGQHGDICVLVLNSLLRNAKKARGGAKAVGAREQNTSEKHGV